ncbi:MAG: hypothetical protein KGL43_04930 [Burkholderiales bacterium]|nr:hypothetical protein [Burkholderiales bacterium]
MAVQSIGPETGHVLDIAIYAGAASEQRPQSEAVEAQADDATTTSEAVPPPRVEFNTAGAVVPTNSDPAGNESNRIARHATPTQRISDAAGLDDNCVRDLAHVLQYRFAVATRLDGPMQPLAERVDERDGIERTMSIAAAVTSDATRQLGEMLAVMPKATGAKGIGPIAVPDEYRNDAPTLADLGLTKKKSVTAQKLASLPAALFEQMCDDRAASSRAGEYRRPTERRPDSYRLSYRWIRPPRRLAVTRHPSAIRSAPETPECGAGGAD